MKNNKTIRGSKGGQIMAIRQREEAIALYYTNPNICKFCNSVITVHDNQKIKNIKHKKFCNKSCAAKFNNIGVCRHRTKEQSDNDIKYPTKRKRKQNTIPLPIYKDKISISSITKGELFKTRTTWQNARSAIQKHARATYFESATHTHCCVLTCTYATHIDVAHIKPVCEFTDNNTISEINTKENLMGLCKNHHWEFDNGYITMKDIQLPY